MVDLVPAWGNEGCWGGGCRHGLRRVVEHGACTRGLLLHPPSSSSSSAAASRGRAHSGSLRLGGEALAPLMEDPRRWPRATRLARFRQWVRGYPYCTPLMAGDESFRRSASSSTSWARRSLPSRPPPRSRCRISPSMAPPLSVASRSPLFASFASANAAAILCSVLMPAAALDLVLVVAGDLVGAVHPAAVHGGISRHRARGDGDVQLCPEACARSMRRSASGVARPHGCQSPVVQGVQCCH